ncbi:TIGR02391 family protein [Streptomyces olivaceus]|uniref:TIGR02391 family protein n=1 Tax=Streptomyces olivaceus TaxID=47716 RepID=UPI00378C27CC
MSETRLNHDRHTALHPWIRDAAAGLLADGYYRLAVHHAACTLTDYTQKKLNRYDVSDKELMQEAFSTKPAAPGKPRLRAPGCPNNRTVISLESGAGLIAAGCYAAIRNPASHGITSYTLEQAVEQLTVLSFTARLIEDFYVLTA